MKKREFAVAKLSELKDGEMKEVEADGTKILLARTGGKCFAVGAHCTHYGAPLVEGFLSGERIVCPWHHACFDVATGDLEEPPAFDALPRFDVKIEGEKIFVHVPENAADRRTPPMTKRDARDKRQFVILGGGAAGFMAAQTLREEGFTGRVLMITREDRLPYDRPNLSKDYLQGHAEPAWMPLRDEEFFTGNGIEIRRDKEAEKVDAAANAITFSDGEILEYDSLLIATGGVPRRLAFQTEEKKNVFLLRSFADSDAIIAAAEKGKQAVVIGASFIGMEAACSLRERGCEVTVVAPDKVPFEKILGAEIGRLFQNIHERKGVSFRLGTQVENFEGAGGRVETVVLENGEPLKADFVVVGIGVAPATGFLEGVKLHKDGGVIADEFLRVAENVYAAGDIAHFPDARSKDGELLRVEHWRFAMQQGRTAARNMAGGHEPFTAVPFFWTTQFGATLNYVGHAKDWVKIIVEGSIERQEFLAFYVKDGRILAVAGMNRDREVAEFEERLRLNKMPPPERISGEDDIPEHTPRGCTGLF
jgi:NADPH-dependent 2,4-dienoyl-CoA reductase/sulfur reductase-like enzyme/nitrite reductase/ring-hydroxylating ferredoxin subunit